MSKRAYLSDFGGSWDMSYDALSSLKDEVRRLHDQHSTWWKLRSEKSLDNSRYPVTSSADEWAAELMNLDQLVVEGFEEKWFIEALRKEGIEPTKGFGSLRLTQQWLETRLSNADETKSILEPLQTLHYLRTKLKGHAASERTVIDLRRTAVREHKSLIEHFRHLCEKVDKSLRMISSHTGSAEQKDLA